MPPSKIDGKQFFWDDGQCSFMCQQFLKCLSSFIIGSVDSKLDLNDLALLNLVKSLKIHCIMFLLVLTHDAPREGCDAPFERIWQILFEHLFPTYDCNATHHGDYFGALSARQSSSIHRQRYLLTDENMGSQAANAIHTEMYNYVPYRILLFQLFYQIIRSSNHVRHGLFDTKMTTVNPAFRDDVTIARRIYAFLLDELQMSQIPLLRQHLSAPNCDEGCNDVMISHVLSLTWYATRIFTLLCENKSGFTLIRTQMKVGIDVDSTPGVAVIVDLLEFAMDALVNETFVVNHHTQLNCIASSCVAFFYQLLRQCHDDTKINGKEVEGTLFASILFDAERLSNLQSCCLRIFHFNTLDKDRDLIGDITKKRVRQLLQESETGFYETD